MSPTSYDLARLRKKLKPYRLHWFPRLRSTSDHAAELRRKGELFAPAVVLTGHQLAGRGRGPNTWFSAAGCITATFVFAADTHFAPHQVPLIAGLAVRRAVAEMCDGQVADSVQLKWPNDVHHAGRKIAGLLCERVHKADLVGVGLNVNLDLADAPPTLRGTITSLSQINGRPLDLTDALTSLGSHLHAALSKRDELSFVHALREYDRHHALLGRRVSITGSDGEPPVTGKCEGLDSDGRLLVRGRTALHRVVAGHVVVL